MFAAIVFVTKRFYRRAFVLRLACAAAVLGVWVEKGMGLVIPGFVPSPLGEIVDYTPSFTEFCVSASIWAFGALVYRVLPAPLSRIERSGTLPEDLGGRKKAIDERTFGDLTGKSEVTKTLWARILRPYAKSPVGPLALTLSGRTLGDEQRRIRARITTVLAGRAGDKLAGLDALIRLAVERRALPAQRVLQTTLRAWLPLHVALSAIALVLLVLHAWLATRYR